MVFRFKKTWSILFIVLVFLALLMAVEYYQKQNLLNNGPMVGGYDEHECIPTAGYRWNETDGACVREWEKQNASSKYDYMQRFMCSDEMRNVEACIEIYLPVCGFPEEKTFSNSCFACIEPEVEYYYQGAC